MPDRRVALAAFALFAILVLLVAVVLKPAPVAVQEPTAAPLLLSLDPASVTRVEVQASDGTLVLERSEGQWRILSPVQSAADSATIGELMTTLASLPLDRTLSAEAAPAEFGLDPVATTITITGAGPAQTTIEVGEHNPDETKRYVRLRGNESIHLVLSYQLDRLIAMVTAPPLPPTPTPEVTLTATAQS